MEAMNFDDIVIQKDGSFKTLDEITPVREAGTNVVIADGVISATGTSPIVRSGALQPATSNAITLTGTFYRLSIKRMSVNTWGEYLISTNITGSSGVPAVSTIGASTSSPATITYNEGVLTIETASTGLTDYALELLF